MLDNTTSPELRNLLRDLLSGTVNSLDALMLLTADHVFDNLDAADSLARSLEEHVLRVTLTTFSFVRKAVYFWPDTNIFLFPHQEISNGRLFRLVCKLNSVIERQE